MIYGIGIVPWGRDCKALVQEKAKTLQKWYISNMYFLDSLWPVDFEKKFSGFFRYSLL